jgi:hypothetical protein
MTATITKTQAKKLMEKNGVEGTLTGRGAEWEVELPNEKAKRAFTKHVGKFGGFKTGYGGWVLRPNYQARGDWNDKTSRHHY